MYIDLWENEQIKALTSEFFGDNGMNNIIDLFIKLDNSEVAYLNKVV